MSRSNRTTWTLPATLLTLFLADPATAAPGPWGIAINAATHECGGYWAGDEDVHYDLPAGFTAYYPTHDGTERPPIQTPFGSCAFDRIHEETCCQQLGLTFVGEVGQEQGCSITGRSSGGPALSIPLALLLVGWWIKRRQTAAPQ